MKKERFNPYNVKVGQVWQDLDPRLQWSNPVLKKVMKIKKGFAYCKSSSMGSTINVRINLKRFKAGSHGYRLVIDIGDSEK